MASWNVKNYPQKAEFSIEIFCKGSNFLTKEINYKLFYSGLVEFLSMELEEICREKFENIFYFLILDR